jgi:protein-S-isoprenylcysteine O-methyltransferase Ste14
LSQPVLLLHLLNFLFVGLLPVLFFRRDGRLGAMWWLTALPFFLCPALIVVGMVTDATALGPAAWDKARELASVAVAVASIGLLFLTLGTHRIPLALWHQENDAPRHLVTYGAHSRIRHPFYTSFLLAFLGAFLFFPHWGTAVLLAYAFGILNVTAAREERRLSASGFGDEYVRYARVTGRFLPRPGARAGERVATR